MLFQRLPCGVLPMKRCASGPRKLCSSSSVASMRQFEWAMMPTSGWASSNSSSIHAHRNSHASWFWFFFGVFGVLCVVVFMGRSTPSNSRNSTRICILHSTKPEPVSPIIPSSSVLQFCVGSCFNQLRGERAGIVDAQFTTILPAPHTDHGRRNKTKRKHANQSHHFKNTTVAHVNRIAETPDD